MLVLISPDIIEEFSSYLSTLSIELELSHIFVADLPSPKIMVIMVIVRAYIQYV